jgi:hypothetical protein
MRKLNKIKAIGILLTTSLLFTAGTINAQVGIGTSKPAASAQLDVSSTSKGFLPPRMTQVQRDSIASPAEGLLIYQTDSTAGVYYYNGIYWKLLEDKKQVQNGIPVVVTQEDFSFGALRNYWSSSLSGKGIIRFQNDATASLATDGPDLGGPTIAKLYSNKQKSVNEGTLVFSTVAYSYQDNNIAYGPLSNGLVNGTDRSNAIEFIIINGSTIQARTVLGGVATTTNYFVGFEGVAKYYSYTIIATKSKVEFFLDGTIIATHTSNIPTAALNMYFDTSAPGGNVPHVIDDAKFEIVP